MFCFKNSSKRLFNVLLKLGHTWKMFTSLQMINGNKKTSIISFDMKSFKTIYFKIANGKYKDRFICIVEDVLQGDD